MFFIDIRDIDFFNLFLSLLEKSRRCTQMMLRICIRMRLRNAASTGLTYNKGFTGCLYTCLKIPRRESSRPIDGFIFVTSNRALCVVTVTRSGGGTGAEDRRSREKDLRERSGPGDHRIARLNIGMNKLWGEWLTLLGCSFTTRCVTSVTRAIQRR